jgi:hypothetical protein
MSFQEKLDAALVLIKEYNSVVGKDLVGGDEFIANIKRIGNTSEADLCGLKWEYILQCLDSAIKPADVDVSLHPIKLAQKIADVWRANCQPQEDSKSNVVSAKKAEKMSVRELVQHIDPEEPESPVAKRLNGWAKGRPFIVYKTGREVDVDATFEQISALKSGHPAITVAMVGGIPKQVYSLGELPDNFADENPLYPNRPLRPDGTCDQSLRSWLGLDLEVRKFIRVAMNENEIIVNRVDDVHRVLDMLLANSDTLNYLRGRYPKISIKFDELKKRNKLPELLISLVSQKQLAAAEGQKRPFDEGKKVVSGDIVPPSWVYSTWNTFVPAKQFKPFNWR